MYTSTVVAMLLNVGMVSVLRELPKPDYVDVKEVVSLNNYGTGFLENDQHSM
jgi:hypothetical protein